MRVIVMFDLPMGTRKEIRSYSKFRKFLIKSGFIMMQESVYSKLTLNAQSAEAVMRNVRLNKPPAGLVQMMIVTEKQFSKIEYVVGSKKTDVLDSDERLVII